MRFKSAAVACMALLIVVETSQAGLIITYQDVGSDLQFDYSGSLNIATASASSSNLATVSLDPNPVFFSASHQGFAGQDDSVSGTSGLFATNLPTFSSIQGTRSGTSFLFRLNNPGQATENLQLWGDWGAANAPINGQLILTNQSANSIGMVDGWNVQTDWGSISFQALSVAPAPEPASMTLFAIGASFMGIAAARRRRREQ